MMAQAEYFSKVFTQHCQINDGNERLLSAFRVIARAADDLQGVPSHCQTREMLRREYIKIACYLLDEAYRQASSSC